MYNICMYHLILGPHLRSLPWRSGGGFRRKPHTSASSRHGCRVGKKLLPIQSHPNAGTQLVTYWWRT